MPTLIVAPHSLAEAVMTQPLLVVLSRLRPGGRIDVLAHPDVVPIYESMPVVNAITPSGLLRGRANPLSLMMLARKLDRAAYHRAYVLADTHRAALLPWLARIPIRIAAHSAGRWGLINVIREPVASDRPRSREAAVDRFARLAFEASPPLPGVVPNPILTRRTDREANARRHAGLPQDARLLVLCPDDEGQPSRRWPVRHWAALIAMAAWRFPEMTPVLVGSAAIRDFATEAVALSGIAARNLCGQQTVVDLVATLSQADAVVAHDNELSHVAAGYTRPLVSVYGPTDPRMVAPRSPRARIEWLHPACSPCDDAQCRFGHGQCLSLLSPEAVGNSLQAVVRRVPRDIR